MIGRYERGHPHPVGHRARRRPRRGAALAAGLAIHSSSGHVRSQPKRRKYYAARGDLSGAGLTTKRAVGLARCRCFSGGGESLSVCKTCKRNAIHLAGTSRGRLAAYPTLEPPPATNPRCAESGRRMLAVTLGCQCPSETSTGTVALPWPTGFVAGVVWGGATQRIPACRKCWKPRRPAGEERFPNSSAVLCSLESRFCLRYNEASLPP